MRIYEIITVLLTVLVLLNTEHKRHNIDSTITDVATSKEIKTAFLNVTELILNMYNYQTAKAKHYINLLTNPLDNLLTTRSILPVWEIAFEPYQNWQVGCNDHLDRAFGDISVLSRTWARSGGTEPLLTPLVLAVSLTMTQLWRHYWELENLQRCAYSMATPTLLHLAG